MGNDLIKRLKAAVKEGQDIGFQAGYQCACDIWSIAISESEGTGPVVMARIADKTDEIYKQYGKAWLPSDPEADWMQEQVDARLKHLYPERFAPFYDRNKWVQPVVYGKKGVKR